MAQFRTKQIEQLLKPINKGRVKNRTVSGNTLSYVEAYEIKAHLSRVFGFGGWCFEVLSASLVHAGESANSRGNINQDVSYLVVGKLTVYDPSNDITQDAIYTEAAIGSAHLPDAGEAHDMAVKTAASDALKRCASCLGDQFGLSLYKKTAQFAPLVQDTLVKPTSIQTDGEQTDLQGPADEKDEEGTDEHSNTE